MKKLLSIFLSVTCLLAFYVIPASAEGIKTDNEMIVTENIAVQMAERFADSVVPEKNLIADDPIKFYDPDGQAIGYFVNYYINDTEPCGYIVFDNANENIISEYSFESNSLNPYECILRNNDVSLYSKNINHVYKTAPFTYGIIDYSDNVLVNNYGEVKEINDTDLISSYNAYDPTTWEEVIMDVSDVYEGYSLVEQNNLETFIAYEEDYVESVTGHYACALNALLACADYYGALDFQNLSDEYMDLWDATDTTELEPENGIIYGTTPINKIGPGFVNYCSDRGISISQVTKSDPDYNFFTKCIDGGNIALFHAGIYDRYENTRSGHTMAVEGYTTLKGYETGKILHTLMISDGWNSYVRYINFDFDGWMDTNGTTFKR